MSLFKIAWRSLQQRPLSSSLTALAMALGVALVVAVMVANHVVSDSFNRNSDLGYNLVVGGKNGSKTELVLSTVFHITRPDQPVPWWYYKELKEGELSQYVLRAVPVCLGDNYQGFRVIATTPEFFDFQYGNEQTYQFAAGRNFSADQPWEAVVGSFVARRTGLKVGDTFQPTHGIETDEGRHDEGFKVVGVLDPTGTPNDRALFVNVEGFFMMDGHDGGVAEHLRRPPGEDENDSPGNEQPADAEQRATEPHAEHQHDFQPLPEEKRAVTAILVRTGSAAMEAMGMGDVYAATAAQQLQTAINRDVYAQAVSPVIAVTMLLERMVLPLVQLLYALTILTVIVSAIGVMVAIYNTMNGRRHEIAVMRALGASRVTVMSIVLLESILLSLLGGAAGMVLGHLIIAAAAPLLIDYTGVVIGLLQFSPWEIFVVPGLIALATLAGYVPAVAAYRTDVVSGLSAME